MAVTAFAGPLIAFGEAPGGMDHNPDDGPSLFAGGVGTLDPRTYSPGQSSSKMAAGWYGTSSITTVDFIPTALGPATVMASQVPVNGTALVLPTVNTATVTVGAKVGGASNVLLIDALRVSATASIAGNIMTVTANTGTLTIGTVMFSATGAIQPTTIVGYGTGRGDLGTYMLDTSQTFASGALIGAPGLNGVPKVGANASQQGTALYNPMVMSGRALSITTAAGDTAVYTLRGYDAYGQPVSEALTAAGATTVLGKKAFKYLASVTPVGTVGATVTVGTTDIFGFPLYSGTFSDVSITWGGTLVTATTGYLPGVGGVATPTTGDVRGTYAVQSASDGAKRLLIRQSPSPLFIGSGLYGVTQA
jgi:hypothetical protein